MRQRKIRRKFSALVGCTGLVCPWEGRRSQQPGCKNTLAPCPLCGKKTRRIG